MPVKEISSFEQFNELINSGKVIVIDFWATWCGPCRVISPIYEKLADSGDYSGVEFYKVDVDSQEQISSEVGIRAMPTFAVFKDGKKVKDMLGANPTGLTQLLAEAKANV
ncbi:hypothetical protein M422DRAFT_241672 [Sphaerobolus stellatus SS14]|nr:hypothetical protein M422DRAFT_241672 [Sphaerobolus stellatus SS14]